MLDLLDTLLFGFVAVSESQPIFLGTIFLFSLACFSLLNRSTLRGTGFTLIVGLASRVTGFGIGLVATFLVTVLLMAAATDKKYYFLLFEFFSAAWLPTVLIIVGFFMYGRALAADSGRHHSDVRG